MTMSPSEELQQTRIPLNTGAEMMPAIGFGTLIPDPAKAKQAVKTALKVGYRQFDTAELYRNEAIVGEALSESFDEGVLRRKELFLVAKLWNNNHRPERLRRAFEASLQRLQVDYVDAYLIHTPFAFPPTDEQHPKDENNQPVYDDGITLEETWRTMEALVDEGKAGAIGLSDINLDRLKQIVATARIKPSIVQIEAHPYLPEWEMLEFCKEHGIVFQAFAALGHAMEPRLLDDPVIVAIAARLGKTPAQVALAWAVQRGTAFLTTSVTPQRIAENFDISPLPAEAMAEMRERLARIVRYNQVVETGVPGFVPPPR
jgi:diketogulonate reductase-like aldo/keto reductase